jgi:rSAM/selenodomain-associated transferase 1
VKSRLARHIGADAAAELYRHFIQTTVSLALGARPLLTPVGVCTPDTALGEIRSLVDSRLPLWPQGEGSLGERMHRSTYRAFRGGAERVVIIGSDSPDLPLSHLLSAARRLDRHDLMLGPADDGGYYLIAMKRPLESLFREIDWSTGRVFQQTVSRARTNGLKTGFLPRWRDVDELSDLRDLDRRIRLRGTSVELGAAVQKALQGAAAEKARQAADDV